MDQEMKQEFAEIRNQFGEVRQRLDKMDQGLGTMVQRLSGVESAVQRQGVLLEDVRSDLKGVAEGVAGTNERLDREFAKLWVKLDERIQPIEVATKRLYRKR